MRTALRTILLAIREAWNPTTALFANGEVGVFYDCSDLTTMFQDSAGTTPVTAVEQPVGLLLDKSKGLVLGPELVTNGDFSNGAVGWSFGTINASISGGTLNITGSILGGTVIVTNATPLVVGKVYQVVYTITGLVGSISSGGGLVGNPVGTDGTYSSILTATSTSFQLVGRGSGATAGSIDNISVRELPGNAGKQATAAARPVLRASPTRIDYDAVDDTLVATFADSLGTDCTVCRAVPSVGASILTAQTIGTTYTDNTDHCGLIIVNRSLTAAETASVTAYLNAKAGV